MADGKVWSLSLSIFWCRLFEIQMCRFFKSYVLLQTASIYEEEDGDDDEDQNDANLRDSDLEGPDEESEPAAASSSSVTFASSPSSGKVATTVQVS